VYYGQWLYRYINEVAVGFLVITMLNLRRYRIFLLVVIATAVTIYYLTIPRRSVQLNDQFRPFSPQREPVAPKVPEQLPPQREPYELYEPYITESGSVTSTVLDESFLRTSTAPYPAESTSLRGQEPLLDVESTANTHGKDVLKEQTPTLRWRQHKEYYPIADEELISLPTGQAKPLPKVQHEFDVETTSEKEDRLKKQTIIRKSFEHAWRGYKQYALPHDELKPLSKDYADPKQFMGWGATLVDGLA
jgi:hypothetical protein